MAAEPFRISLAGCVGKGGRTGDNVQMTKRKACCERRAVYSSTCGEGILGFRLWAFGESRRWQQGELWGEFYIFTGVMQAWFAVIGACVSRAVERGHSEDLVLSDDCSDDACALSEESPQDGGENNERTALLSHDHNSNGVGNSRPDERPGNRAARNKPAAE